MRGLCWTFDVHAVGDPSRSRPGLLFTSPAQTASPAETMETFFEQAGVFRRGGEHTRGIEETRQAICQHEYDMIEFRKAAAHALGPAWGSPSVSWPRSIIGRRGDRIEPAREE